MIDRDERFEAEWLQVPRDGREIADLDAWARKAAWALGGFVGCAMIAMFGLGMAFGGFVRDNRTDADCVVMPPVAGVE